MGNIVVCMRLADMATIHPQQDNTRVCDVCKSQVGIYPSGQSALWRDPDARIHCQRCFASLDKLDRLDLVIPAARTVDEMLREHLASVPKDKK